jgi:hypothetical protein
VVEDEFDGTFVGIVVVTSELLLLLLLLLDEELLAAVEGCVGNGYCRPFSDEIDEADDGFGLL